MFKMPRIVGGIAILRQPIIMSVDEILHFIDQSPHVCICCRLNRSSCLVNPPFCRSNPCLQATLRRSPRVQ